MLNAIHATLGVNIGICEYILSNTYKGYVGLAIVVRVRSTEH